MILSGVEIRSRLGEDIIIKPYDKKQLNPNSYNLKLGDKLKVYDTGYSVIKLVEKKLTYKDSTTTAAEKESTVNVGEESTSVTDSYPEVSDEDREIDHMTLEIRGYEEGEIEDSSKCTVSLLANTPLDMKAENATKELTIPEEGLVIYPGRIYLGTTVEYTETKNLIPGLEGRSSVGRLGISVHETAGFGDVGFKGHWTLEISCQQPVRIYPNVEICQIYYNTVSDEHENYTSEKYQGQIEPEESKLWMDFRQK